MASQKHINRSGSDTNDNYMPAFIVVAAQCSQQAAIMKREQAADTKQETGFQQHIPPPIMTTKT